MGYESEKALKANVPNSHPGLLLRTLEYAKWHNGIKDYELKPLKIALITQAFRE